MVIATKDLPIERGYSPDLEIHMGEVNRQYILVPSVDISGYSVRSEIVKPDGTFVYTDQAINTDGNILFTIPEQAGAVAGYGHYIIKIYNLNTVVYSCVGTLRIDDHLILDGMIESVADVNGYTFPDDFVIRGELGNIFDDSTVSNETGWTSLKISQEIGSAAVVFDDTQISNTLGWTSNKINSELLGMIDNNITSNTKSWSSSKIESEIDAVIDDTTTSVNTGWSSSKIDSEIAASDKPVSKTASGNPIELTDAADAPMVSCVTEIQGSQDLHGYDKPWVGGAGKNILPTGYHITERNGVTPTINADGSFLLSGTTNSTYYCYIKDDIATLTLPAGTYTFTIWKDGVKGTGGLTGRVRCDIGGQPGTNIDLVNGVATVNVPEGTTVVNFYLSGSSGIVTDGLYHAQIEAGSSSSSTWTPYSNICPITAYNTGAIAVSDEDSNTTTYTTTYPSAIYRGSEDVAEGSVTSEMVVIDLGTISWGKQTSNFLGTIPGIKRPDSNQLLNAVCSAYEITAQSAQTPNTISGLSWTDGIAFWNTSIQTAEEVATLMSGVMLAYELNAPTTSTVTVSNSPIRTLSGYNHIESSTGEMEVEYITKTYEPIIKALEH